MTSNERRRKMKAEMLDCLGITAYDLTEWEAVWNAAEKIGASKRLVAILADEIGDELRNRAARLSR